MIEHASEFIDEYFERLITHHENIFGVHTDAYLSKVNYIEVHEDIFRFIYLLSQVDEQFEDEFIKVCLDDISNLMQLSLETLSKKKRYESIYSDFLRTITYEYDKDEFIDLLKKEFKLHRSSLKDLLNTKFFYLDKYIWYKINKSMILKEFFEIKKMPNIGSTMAYLEVQKSSKITLSLDYSQFQLNSDEKYKSSDVEFVKDLLNHKEEIHGEIIEFDKDDPLEQLIRYKKYIPYFKDITDENARKLVEDVQFRRFKKYETIISEYEDDQDIFFLVEGCAEISLANRNLGLINPKSIFGEFSFITNRLRSASIKAQCDSVIISFKLNMELFDKEPLLYPQLYKNIAEELVKKFYTININYVCM